MIKSILKSRFFHLRIVNLIPTKLALIELSIFVYSTVIDIKTKFVDLTQKSFEKVLSLVWLKKVS